MADISDDADQIYLSNPEFRHFITFRDRKLIHTGVINGGNIRMEEKEEIKRSRIGSTNVNGLDWIKILSYHLVFSF